MMALPAYIYIEGQEYVHAGYTHVLAFRLRPEKTSCCKASVFCNISQAYATGDQNLICIKQSAYTYLGICLDRTAPTQTRWLQGRINLMIVRLADFSVFFCDASNLLLEICLMTDALSDSGVVTEDQRQKAQTLSQSTG